MAAAVHPGAVRRHVVDRRGRGLLPGLSLLPAALPPLPYNHPRPGFRVR
jgi:hypothetical protein